MLAYHAVVRAMEARAGVSPLQRLWLSIRHAVDGHLPYERYQAAGFARAGERASSSQIERWMFDWLSTDINPAAQIGRMSATPESLAEAYNHYNRRACLAVRTTMRVEPGAKIEFRRDLLSSRVDPEPCKLGTLTVFRTLLEQASSGERAGAMRASHVARMIGVEGSATAQAAEVLEDEVSISVPELARRLGCGKRSLERKLKEEGGTAEQIKMACRIVKVQDRIASKETLTEVALECGFSDSAHLSRAFKKSCGLTPAEMRSAVLGTLPANGQAGHRSVAA